jgi:hypothetical protein
MPQLPAGVYQGASQNLHTFAPFVDRNGTPLDTTNGSVTVTIVNLTTGATPVSGAAAIYLGTPGNWGYTGVAATYPAWSAAAPQQVQVTAVGSDQTGATVYRQQDQLLWPHGPLSGRYARLSANTLAFPHVSGIDHATASLTNNAGATVLAATAMTHDATVNLWLLTPSAALFVINDRFLVTMLAYDSSNTLLLTTLLWLRDAAQ